MQLFVGLLIVLISIKSVPRSLLDSSSLMLHSTTGVAFGCWKELPSSRKLLLRQTVQMQLSTERMEFQSHD